jgi:hypothetical protein
MLNSDLVSCPPTKLPDLTTGAFSIRSGTLEANAFICSVVPCACRASWSSYLNNHDISESVATGCVARWAVCQSAVHELAGASSEIDVLLDCNYFVYLRVVEKVIDQCPEFMELNLLCQLLQVADEL